MNELKEFLVLRYSLVEEQQHSAIIEPIPSPKGKAILVAITQDREFLSKGTRYGFVGFSEILPAGGINFPPGRFFLGKTAKLKKAHMGRKVPGDIIETEEDDWLPLITIIDTETQHIFVKKDWRFGTPEQTIRAIQAGLREPILALYNHRIFVEGKTKVEHFWKVVSEHKRIYMLELNLISPNILETNQSAREALAALKSLFGQDETIIKLENESGELKVPKAPVENYLEYIEEGEGSWSVTTEGARGGKKKHSSFENLDIVELPVVEPMEASGYSQMRLDGEENNTPNRITSDALLIATVYAEVSKIRDR
jgi:hypothetical protein